MTTREYYVEMKRLDDQNDFRGMLNLMGEEYGKLEGDFTPDELNDLRLMRNWAKRLVEPEEYEAILARVNARIDERIAREAKPQANADPNVALRRYRFWSARAE